MCNLEKPFLQGTSVETSLFLDFKKISENFRQLSYKNLSEVSKNE